MKDIVRHSYRIVVEWKNGNITGQTLTDYDILMASVQRFRQDPTVLEVRVNTYETRTMLVREEVFSSLVEQS